MSQCTQICDWSVRNQVVLTYSCSRPPLFLSTNGDRIPLQLRSSASRASYAIIVFTPVTSDQQPGHLDLIKNCILIHQSAVPIRWLKWNDSGSKLIAIDQQGSFYIWSNEIFMNEFALIHSSSFDDTVIAARCSESFRHLSLVSETDFTDLKRRHLLGLQSIHQNLAFCAVTRKRKLVLIYMTGNTFHRSEIELSIPYDDEMKEYFESQEILDADILLLPNNTCEVALTYSKHTAVFFVEGTNDLFNNTSLTCRLEALIPNIKINSRMKLLPSGQLVFIHNEKDEKKKSIQIFFVDWKQSSKELTQSPQIIDQGELTNLWMVSVDTMFIPNIAYKAIIYIGTQRGEHILIDATTRQILPRHWPPYSITANKDKPVGKFYESCGSILQNTTLLIDKKIQDSLISFLHSPNQASYLAIYQSEISGGKSDSMYLTIQSKMYSTISPFFSEQLHSDTRFIAYMIARYLTSIYSLHDVTDLDNLVRIIRLEKNQIDLTPLMTTNVSKILMKSNDDLSVFQYLFKRATDLRSKQAIYGILKLFSVYEMLIMCFEDGYDVRQTLEASIRPITHRLGLSDALLAFPFCVYVMERLSILLRQAYVYFNLIHIKQNLKHGWYHTLHLFCPLTRGILMKLCRLVIAVQSSFQALEEGKNNEHHANQYAKAILNHLQSYSARPEEILSVLEEVTKILDAVQPKNPFDDVNDFYIKGTLPKRIQDNLNVMMDIMNVIKDRVPKIGQESSKGSPNGRSSLEMAATGGASATVVVADSNSFNQIKSQYKQFAAFVAMLPTLFDTTNITFWDGPPMQEKDMVQIDMMRLREKIKAHLDCITHLSLEKADVIRQCNRCGLYSHAHLSDSKLYHPNKSHSQSQKTRTLVNLETEIVLPSALVSKGLYTHNCLCGGFWMKIIG